ncbi:MAG TPA: class I SAM-dependent methyltransferase [Acidobacteriaceae bacterium]|jgi:SAM-dependent methyltransferase|nr:class I SAM-dependent methyltransferase [Acidobacteriaceae bacterium]
MAAIPQTTVGDDYVLKTGGSGAERLRLLDKVYGASTRRMLLEAGLKPGMRVLDMACGVGTVTCWIAGQVGETGSVVAADVSPDQLAVARATWASCEGLPAVEFIEASVYDTGLPAESFDLVHTRLLLCHLNRPQDAVREFYRLLKPGGVFVCSDLYLSGTFSMPPSRSWTRSIEVAHALGRSIGVDYDSGLKLQLRMMEAGFERPEVSFDTPVYMRGAEKRLWELTFAEAGPAMERAGVATVSEVEELAAQMKVEAEDETTLMVQYPLLCAWAVK